MCRAIMHRIVGEEAQKLGEGLVVFGLLYDHCYCMAGGQMVRPEQKGMTNLDFALQYCSYSWDSSSQHPAQPEPADSKVVLFHEISATGWDRSKPATSAPAWAWWTELGEACEMVYSERNTHFDSQLMKNISHMKRVDVSFNLSCQPLPYFLYHFAKNSSVFYSCSVLSAYNVYKWIKLFGGVIPDLLAHRPCPSR